MSRKKIIIGLSIAVVSVAAIVAVVIVFADVVFTRQVDRLLKEQIAQIDSLYISYSDLDIRIGPGTIRLDDIVIKPVTDTASSSALHHTTYSSKPQVALSCKKIEVGNIRLFQTWRRKRLNLDYLDIVEPDISLTLASPQPKTQSAKSQPQAAVDDSIALSEGLEKVRAFVTKACLETFRLTNGTISMQQAGTKLKLAANHINLTFSELGYDIDSLRFSYCDSLYLIALDSLRFSSEDGLYAIAVNHVYTSNAGPIVIEQMRGGNTVRKEQLADLQGKVPTTWTDMQLSKISTSPINIISSVERKKVNIAHLDVLADNLSLYRDVRYRSKKPYPMPQENIKAIPVPINIGAINIQAPQVEIQVKMKVGEAGSINMHKVQLSVNNFTNQIGKEYSIHGQMGMGNGKGDVRLTFKNDKQDSFRANMKMTNMLCGDLDDFLHPMMGISMSGQIHEMTTSFTGNDQVAEGTFCMLYDSLTAHVYKDEAPIQALQKNAELINMFAGMILKNSNPRANNQQPFSCKVNAECNPMKDFAEYVTAPMVDGIMHTVFPEFVYKQVKKIQSKM